MKKYVIIVIIIALIILSIFSLWFFFIKKNPTLENYEKEFNEKINAINNQIEDNQPNNSDPVINPDGEVKPIIDDDKLKPNDGQIIISSETKVLNEQGQELLDELSKQLEESFQTISTTTGVIDSEILNNESDINMGE